jgi:acetylornithine deacetylase/succinyl-diaminopimelate desuccinylase-like protein
MTPLRTLIAALWALALPAAALAAAAPPTPPRSPAASDALAHDIFAELVAIDTTHAKGDAKAAEALIARFKAAGFADADLFIGGPKPDKMNVVVRLRGTGKGQPVLFNAHLDVVEAVRDTWSVEPFELTEKDGYYWGRGTIDVKNEVAILSANLIRLKREGWKPGRDIILAFNVDEEAGGDANGVEWLLKEKRPLVAAGLVINHDAGHGYSRDGTKLWNALQTSEKAYATYSLTTRGSGGHSSLPPRYNAIVRLAQALVRLDAYQFPVRLSETTRGSLGFYAARIGGEEGEAIRAILADPSDATAAERLRDSRVANSQLHSTCPVTLVSGGQSESALPIKATATIQCRLLPDEDADEVLAILRRVIEDPAVEIGVEFPPDPSPPTPLDPAVVATVARVTQSMWPGVPVVPVMSSGASDNVFWRGAGLKAYGVSGTFVDENDLRAHGKDERVAIGAFYESLEFSYRLMKALAGAR